MADPYDYGAYRQYLAQTQSQRQETAKRFAKMAENAAQSLIAPPPEPQDMSANRGKATMSSQIAPRPPVNIVFPKFAVPANYPTEPIGAEEIRNPKRFVSWEKDVAHLIAGGYTPERAANVGRTGEQANEILNKRNWRLQIAQTDNSYAQSISSFNKQVEDYNAKMRPETTARIEAANMPQPTPQPTPQQTSDPRVRRRNERGTLLAGNTGGFNPATGGGRLGGRSLLG
jgi:hypothetical protein